MQMFNLQKDNNKWINYRQKHPAIPGQFNSIHSSQKKSFCYLSSTVVVCVVVHFDKRTISSFRELRSVSWQGGWPTAGRLAVSWSIYNKKKGWTVRLPWFQSTMTRVRLKHNTNSSSFPLTRHDSPEKPPKRHLDVSSSALFAIK